MSSVGASGDASRKTCGFPAINKTSLTKCYGPAVGAISHSLLGLNVLNPSLTLGVVSKRNLTNVLLGGSIVGVALYLNSRPHLQKSQYVTLYAVSGSVLFSFSSILLWAIIRSMLPNNAAVSSAVGLASSYVLLKGGHSYIKLIDSQIAKE